MAQRIHLILEDADREVERATLTDEQLGKVNAGYLRSNRPERDEHGQLVDPNDANPGRFVLKRTVEQWQEVDWKHRLRTAQVNVPIDKNIGRSG